MFVKQANGRAAFSGAKPFRFGQLLAAVQSDEAMTLGQYLSANFTIAGSSTYSGTITNTNTTESSSSTTGAITTSGGIGVAKNGTIGGQLVAKKNVIRANTTYTAGTDTTAGWTLTEVKNGLIAGTIKSTTAAAVTLTLDSVANIITAFAAAGVTIGAGTTLEFVLDNTGGANTLTLAVDGGATIAVATPVITGGATLTVSTANKVGRFQLYIYSATAAILSRIV